MMYGTSPPPMVTGFSPPPLASVMAQGPGFMNYGNVQPPIWTSIPTGKPYPTSQPVFGVLPNHMAQSGVVAYPSMSTKPAARKSTGAETVVNQQGQLSRLTTIGDPLNDKLETVDKATGETQAGVGIFFQQETNSWVYVASIVPNSSADRCGLIRGDDELTQVDAVKITAQESLADVRLLILGPPGSYVAMSFRRPGGQYGNGNRSDYYYYDVELMRGSVDFIQMQMAQQPDYQGYELEIARLRDEIDALRHQQEQIPEDPRVAPLEDELKARMDDLRRFEQMLMRSQERAQDAEKAQQEAQESLHRLQDENQRLTMREREHAGTLEESRSKFANQKTNLDQMRRQLSQELDAERSVRSSVDQQLHDVQSEIAKLKGDAAAQAGRHTDTRARLRQGHLTIREALQAQEQQLSTLADVIPALDMVHSSLISSIALDPIRLQTLEFSVPRIPSVFAEQIPHAPPQLSQSIYSLQGALDYSEIKMDHERLEKLREQTRKLLQEDVA